MRMSNGAKNNLHAHFWPDFRFGGDSFVSIELTKNNEFFEVATKGPKWGIVLVDHFFAWLHRSDGRKVFSFGSIFGSSKYSIFRLH